MTIPATARFHPSSAPCSGCGLLPSWPLPASNEALAIDAVEIDRIVPVSDNLGCVGQHLRTLPSRLASIDLARLRAQDARSAGPPPARPSWTQLTAGAPVEIQRMVNATGTVAIAGKYHSVAQQLAGRRITLRPPHAHIVLDGVLTRTIR